MKLQLISPEDHPCRESERKAKTGDPRKNHNQGDSRVQKAQQRVGPGEYLNLNWPPKQKQAYVRLRTWGDHLVRGAKPPCKHCKEAEANPTHLLVTCPKLAESRKTLINELKIISPATYNLLKKSNSREKTSIMLGNNESAEANVKWPQCQEAFSRHALRICSELDG